jgi:hypothetical protein
MKQQDSAPFLRDRRTGEEIIQIALPPAADGIPSS